MESLSRAFAAWLRSTPGSVPEGAASLRIRKNVLLPGGERCPFVTVTTLVGGRPEHPTSRVIDLWDLGPGAVGPEGARRMSLNLHLIEAWSWERLENFESAGERRPETLDVRGNLVGRTVGDEALFDILGNCGRRIRLWTHVWDGERLLVNPYLSGGASAEIASGLDEALTEPDES